MANEINNISSASITTVVLSDKSGHSAAQPLLNGADAVDNSSVRVNQIDDSEQLKKDPTSEENRKSIEKQAQNLQALSDLKGWSVSFRIDNELDKTVITVVDSVTQKPIRQIPDEDLLDLSKRIKELTNVNNEDGLKGLFLDSKI